MYTCVKLIKLDLRLVLLLLLLLINRSIGFCVIHVMLRVNEITIITHNESLDLLLLFAYLRRVESVLCSCLPWGNNASGERIIKRGSFCVACCN